MDGMLCTGSTTAKSRPTVVSSGRQEHLESKGVTAGGRFTETVPEDRGGSSPDGETAGEHVSESPSGASKEVLDVDATEDRLHGKQEGRFFHGYYKCYCCQCTLSAAII